jgi:hypothetical protein
MDRALAEIETRARSGLADGLRPLHDALETRVEGARQTFVTRATVALVAHLERHGELEIWRYDPCGLRALLRSAFQRYARAVGRHGGDSMAAAASELNALWARAYDLPEARALLEPPPLPAPDAPVVLGQTIALDLRGSWWTRFWRRRRGYQACAGDFERLIREETQPILQALLTDHARSYEVALARALEEFLGANRKIMLDLARGGAPGGSKDADDTREAA